MTERHAELPWKHVPWHIEEGPDAVRSRAGYIVCTTAGGADAKLIVRAVNSFDDMLKFIESWASAGDADAKNLLEKHSLKTAPTARIRNE